MIKIKTAVIVVGGMGTRLLPITKTISKEMLPIVDEPSIYLLVKELYQSGIKKIIFVVTKRNKPLIQNFFTYDKYLMNFINNNETKKEQVKEINEIISAMHFTYVYQKERGTYGALYSAHKYIHDEYFIVSYGDDIIDSKIPLTKQLINEFNKNNSMLVAIKEYDKNMLPASGIVKMDQNNHIIDLVKKDKPSSNCVIHGRFILNKKIFTIKEQLKYYENKELYLPHALLNFKEEVKGFKYEGNYFNIGDKLGYIKASIYYGLKRDNLRNDLLNFIKNYDKMN